MKKIPATHQRLRAEKSVAVPQHRNGPEVKKTWSSEIKKHKHMSRRRAEMFSERGRFFCKDDFRKSIEGNFISTLQILHLPGKSLLLRNRNSHRAMHVGWFRQ